MKKTGSSFGWPSEPVTLYSNNFVTGQKTVLTTGPTSHMSRRSSASTRALRCPSRSMLPRYCMRRVGERISRLSEWIMPFVMMKEAVPALARLLPSPGARLSRAGESAPNSGIAQIKPSRRSANPYPRSLRGYGFADLRDGLIWAIPLFGALSPALDSLAPGLGSSRASAGSASFIITNGIIHSDNLEIRSPTLRMQYRGNIDLEGHLNARVEAELLRDMWLVGPVVSTVFWPVTKLFEYRVTGSLGQPKLEPVYFIPRIVQMPFHPFRTLKEMIPEDTSRSNAPPVFEKLPTE